jgi:hypothetical protein
LCGFFPLLILSINFDKKNGLGYWAIFSQTHQVTLPPNRPWLARFTG